LRAIKEIFVLFFPALSSQRKIFTHRIFNYIYKENSVFKVPCMPKKIRGLNTKGAQLTVRATLRIKELVSQIARREDVDISEWLRNLIICELKRYGAIFTLTILEA
jgi:hypothetical protein